jgi:hypothetical protein
MKSTFFRYRPIAVAVVLSLSASLWLAALLQSPIRHPHLMVERQLTPELEETRSLAEAYWSRYRDVRDHEYYGKNGEMGIYGAREHYKNYGKREGRIFGPIPLPDTPRQEPELADAYWQRYPDIEKSRVWGRRSALGILGPRDHYHYLGKNQGRIWGPALTENGN